MYDGESIIITPNRRRDENKSADTNQNGMQFKPSAPNITAVAANFHVDDFCTSTNFELFIVVFNLLSTL